MSLKYLCKHCGYKTNRKWSFEDHISRPSACEKRLRRINNKKTHFAVNDINHMVNVTHHMVNGDSYQSNKVNLLCLKCNKKFANKQSLQRHSTICKGYVNPLQCPTCKKLFSCKQSKYLHSKNVKCEFVEIKDEKDILIEELREELKEKEIQLEEARARPTTVYNTTNNTTNNTWNNYFNPDIKYNDYDKLSTEHITNEQIRHMYIENSRYFPDVSEAVSRNLFRIEENRCIYVPEGQKGSYGIVYKDGKYIRKPITHIFATVCDTGARHIFESGAIPEKDYGDVNSVNFWNDMSRAIGLQKTDYDDLSQFDKDLITRQKYVGLDVQDEN